MTINLAAIKSLLLPGLYKVMDEYPEIPTQWSTYMDKGPNSDKQTEKSTETRMFGLAQLQGEGASVYYDNGAGETYSYNTIHQGVGLGFIITRYALKDNLYKSDFDPNVKNLRFSFKQFKEIYCANLLNNGTTYSSAVGGDGVALFSTAHPVGDAGTQGNRPATDVELNEGSLEAAIIAVKRFRNARGLRAQFNLQKLILPVELQFVGERLFKTEKRVGTGDNDVSAFLSRGDAGGGYTVVDFLTSTKAWFAKTDAPYGLTYTEREPFEYDMQPDFDTQSLKVRAFERYSAWTQNWRGNYGSFPT